MKVEGVRRKRSDKKTRVNASLDQDTHDKLKKLAVSCDMTKTSLATEMLQVVVNHPDFINWFQNKYNENPQYRVIPVNEDGKVYY
uniref:hypothetical protein n=1 Tax=Bacillaceae bacterium JMAK1 TaxID=1028381 RepID=UPI00155D99C5|nr:hypothetical protein [Bacillaceae bacterium JMAK1]